MGRPIETKNEQPTAPEFRYIPEDLYQTVLKVFQESTLPWPGAKVADTITALRDCQPATTEPYPRRVDL